MFSEQWMKVWNEMKRVICMAATAVIGILSTPHTIAQEQISLEELKRRYRRDWVRLSEEIPMMGRGPYAQAAAQLERENADLTHEVVKLLEEKNVEARRRKVLQSRIRKDYTQDDFLETEKDWFESHALRVMSRVEYYQQVFKHPDLDRAEPLFVGSPLCARPERLVVAAGSLLANFAYPVPAEIETGEETREAVIKHARLVATTIGESSAVRFAVLRRFPPDVVDKGVFKVVDVAEPRGEAKPIEKLADGLSIYEWELRTVLRARPRDVLAVLFEGGAEIACDYTGQARFGLLEPATAKLLKQGGEFDSGQFTIPVRKVKRSLDETAACSLGFSGWTSAR